MLKIHGFKSYSHPKNTLTESSIIMFDHISGHHDPAKLGHIKLTIMLYHFCPSFPLSSFIFNTWQNVHSCWFTHIFFSHFRHLYFLLTCQKTAFQRSEVIFSRLNSQYLAIPGIKPRSSDLRFLALSNDFSSQNLS